MRGLGGESSSSINIAKNRPRLNFLSRRPSCFGNWGETSFDLDWITERNLCTPLIASSLSYMTEQPFNTPQLFHPLQRRIRDILIGLNPNIFHHVDTILKCLLDRYPNDPVTPADIISAAEAASSYFLVIPENDSVFIRAVDPISWTHNLQSSPGPSRRTTAIISTPPATTFRSVPPSPTKTFSESQLKRLRKEWEKDESKVQLVEDVLGKVGVIKTREDLISIIGDVLEDRPLDRSFSTMKVSDYHCLFADNAVDLININHASLLSLIPDDSIPSSFLEQLYITRLVSSRGLESGARKVINIFIDNAVFVARSVFQEPRLIVDQETELEPTVVVELNCKVHGPLDYVTARAKGRISMGTSYQNSYH